MIEFIFRGLLMLGLLLGSAQPALAAAQMNKPAAASQPAASEESEIARANAHQGIGAASRGADEPESMESPPSLDVAILMTPEEVIAGNLVTVTLRLHNFGLEPVEKPVVEMPLATGLLLEENTLEPGMVYDPVTRRLVWSIEKLVPGGRVQGAVGVRVQGLAVGTRVEQSIAVRVGAYTRSAKASLFVSPRPQDAVWATPGQGGWLRSEDGRVEVRIPPNAVAQRARISYRGTVEDVEPLPNMSGVFALEAWGEQGKAIHQFSRPITIRYHYTREELNRLNFASRTLYYFDEGKRQWQPVPSQLNLDKGWLEAQVSHFTTFAEGDTGDTFVSEEADRIRGLKPDLFSGTLHYRYGFDLPPGPGGFTPTLGLAYSNARHYQDKGHYSYVGHGWVLAGADAVYIPPGDENLDKKVLILGGQTYSLKYDQGWYAKESPFLKIQASGNANWPDVWEVWTPDGVKYTFGSQAVARVYYWRNCETGNPSKRYVRLPLARIEDTHGNVVTYTWEEETRSKYGCPGYTSAVRLREIDYNGVKVILDYVDRTDEPDGATTGDWKFFPTKKLRMVTVKVGSEVVQQYHLENEEGNSGPTSQRALNLDWVASQYHTGHPRKTWFTYSSRALTNPDSYAYLTEVKNALGGWVTFEGQYKDPAYPVITKMALYDGMDTSSSPTPVATWTYVYQDWDDSGGEEMAKGYKHVTVTRPDGATEEHWFHGIMDSGGQQTDDYAGKEEKVAVKKGGTEMSRQENQWDDTTTSLPAGGRFVFRKEVRRFEEGQGVNRETFAYQTWRQGGKQYGNMTEHRAYEGSGSSWAAEPYRTRYMFYYPNETAWIVNKGAREDVYRVRWGGPNAALVQQTFTYYDQTSDYTAPPTEGLTYRVRTGLGSLWQNTYYAYWANGNLYKVTDANGHATRTYYDGTLHALSVCTRNALGSETKVRYYGVQGHSGAGPDGVACTTASGSSVNLNAGRVFGRMEREEDANGALTTYRYDLWGRLVRRWRPGEEMSRGDGPTEEWVYPGYASTSAPFVVRHRQRDDADGGASAAAYLETWTVFDGLGQPIQTQTEAEVAGVGGKRIVVDKGYDAMGRVAWESVPYSVSSPGGDVYITPQTQPKTQYEYDALGRVTTVTHPDGTQVRTFYSVGQTEEEDERRLVTTVVDENNHQTVQRQDAFGRLRRVDQYEGTYPNVTLYASAQYDYDALDRLTDVYGPGKSAALDASNHTHIDYDALGRKTSMSDPDMGAWSYAYDAAGNLIRQTDARQRTLCYEYDALNRLNYVREDRTEPPDGDCEDDLYWLASYYWDHLPYQNPPTYGVGRRIQMNDRSGHTSWEYDARGRVTRETKSINGAGTFITQWSYDAMDRVKTMTYPNPGSETVTYGYNAQGLLESMTSSVRDDLRYVKSSSYDASGRLTQRVMQHKSNDSGTVAWTTDYGYYPWNQANGQGRLHTLATSGIQNLTYSYDAVGNIKTIVDNENGGQRQCFHYDELNRVTQAFTGNSPCTAYQATGNGAYEKQFQYGANGNLTLNKLVHPNWDSRSYTYHATKPHAVVQAGNDSFDYDANGNMLHRVWGSPSHTYTLSYDGENRLVSVTGGESSASFVYDGDGNRVKATIDGVTTYYVGRYYEYRNSSTYTKYFFAGNDLVAFDRSQGYGNYYGRRYVFRDHLGSTSVIVNGKGNILWKDLYYPFGDLRYHWDDTPGQPQTGYRYTGQRLDAGIAGDLYDYVARRYDPVLARFIQPDTIVPNPGDPQSLNRYSYVGNNPVRYTDPSGHSFRDADESNTCGVSEDCSSGAEIDELYYFIETYGCDSVSPTGLCMDASGEYIPNPVNDEAASDELRAYTFMITVMWEPADWAATFNRWRHGDFSGWDLAGMLPLVSAGGARVLGTKLVKYVDIVPTGQWHHVFSNKIMRQLNKHEILRGVFKRSDILVRALDRESHIGYQKWHRAYDDEVIEWLASNKTASPAEFIDFLTEIHARSDMRHRFPFALDALQALKTKFR